MSSNENNWLISICSIDGCEDVIVVNRRKMKKPLDDLRIVHLRTHKGHEKDIRLRKHFKTIRLTKRKFNEFMMNSLKREGLLH